MESIYATREEILEELTRDGFEDTITKLEDYARNWMGTGCIGFDPYDIVSNVLDGILNEAGGRNWNRSKCPDFYWFLYRAVKSSIYDLRKKLQNEKIAQEGHASIYQSNDFDIEEEVDFAIEKSFIFRRLKELGGDTIEELVLECWFDGINKPQEIAKFLDITESDVYNATKRIKSKRPQIQKLHNHLRQ